MRQNIFPTRAGGTSDEIHGSQAQLEIPRDRLNPNSSARIKPSRDTSFRNTPLRGTSAVAK